MRAIFFHNNHNRIGLSPWHPAALLATGFGTGLLPKAPGSWGSLATLPLAWGLKSAFGRAGLAAAAGLAFGAGCWAAGRVARTSGRPDPGFIVIDEILGQLLALLPARRDPAAYALAFLLFRLFDIGKPWPIGRIDRTVGGGLGIMLDDALAAGYALLAQIALRGAFGVRP
ncbi:MAG: phosphatidylglycerophosphatase A family protein [Stellaceae bacterium]